MRTEQENILIHRVEKNPFANYNGPVDKGHFIGRRRIVREIYERAEQGGNVSIVGLPRIGKTSIMMHCFFDDEQEKLNNGIFCICVTGDVSASTNTASCIFWTNVIEEIMRKLKPIRHHVDSDNDEMVWALEDIDDAYNKLHSNVSVNEVTNILQDIIDSLKNGFNYKIIICVDEFQKVEDYYTKSDYGFMRKLSENHLAVFVVTSRKSIEMVELGCPNHESSYYYNTFDEKIVSTFDKEDEEEYWNRNIDFLPIAKNVMDKYKSLISFYSGSHPCLLNMVNYHALDILRNTDKISMQNLEDVLCSRFENDLDYQIKLLKEEGLLNIAIKLVKGPFEMKDKKYIRRLVDIGFLHKVPTSVKTEMFNQEVGPSIEDDRGDKYSYVCFSDYFTRLFYDKYSPEDVPYYVLWDETENKMRTIVKHYLVSKFGSDAMTPIQHPQYTYCENWIVKMEQELSSPQNPYSNLSNSRGEIKLDKWRESINKMIENRRKQISYFRLQSSLPLVNFTETGQLFYVFYEPAWDWFANVFLCHTSSSWNTNVFYKLLKLRVARQHNNVENIPPQEFELGEQLCNQIQNDIDKYIRENP